MSEQADRGKVGVSAHLLCLMKSGIGLFAALNESAISYTTDTFLLLAANIPAML